MEKIALLIFCLSLTLCKENSTVQASKSKRVFEESSVTSSSKPSSSASIQLILMGTDNLIVPNKHILPIDVEEIREIDLLHSIQSKEIIIAGRPHEIDWAASQPDIHTIYIFFYAHKDNIKISLNKAGDRQDSNSYKITAQTPQKPYILFYLKHQFIDNNKEVQLNNYYFTNYINLMNSAREHTNEGKKLNLSNQKGENFQTHIQWDSIEISSFLSFLFRFNKTLELSKVDNAGKFIISTPQDPQKIYKFTLTGDIIKTPPQNHLE